MLRIGKLFRMSGLGYETLIIDNGYSEDEQEIIVFANSIRGTFLAKALGRVLDKDWYEQNEEDIEMLTKQLAAATTPSMS